MAKYYANSPQFIPPTLIRAEQTFVVDDSWEPNPGVTPLDEAAQAAMDRVTKAKPYLSINPVEDLPMTMVHSVEDTSKAADDGVVDLASAQASVATPGLSNGGIIDGTKQAPGGTPALGEPAKPANPASSISGEAKK